MIVSARDIIKRRQKMVLLADASVLGWRVVNEYEVNPIASDSDDEKRIYKAEARAARKAREDRSKKAKRFGPYRREHPAPTATVSSSQGARQKPGLCFSCGKPGHWKHECPNSNSNNKISISLCSNISETPERVVELNQNEGSEKLRDAIYVSKSTEVVTGIEPNSHTEVGKVSPVGRLKQYANKWKAVSDNSYIIDVISNGYKLPFKSTPDQVDLKNNRSAKDNPVFVESEIASLTQKGVVSEVFNKPHVVNPLTVACGKSGKLRLVLDCRHINPHLHLFKTKFEDIHVAESMFDLDSYIYTFDLKGAYHHVDIFPEHTKFLGFSWEKDGIVRYYVYNSLPFGISTAGHIFTKVLRVLIKYWRSLGHRVIMFLDDGIGADVCQDKAVEQSSFVRSSLIDFGFLLAEEKCSWEPKRVGFWLGHKLDYVSNRIFISDERIERLEMSVKSMLFQVSRDDMHYVPVRVLASLVGQIISLQSVVGKVVCRHTKYLYRCIESRASWNSKVLVSVSAMEEIRFWENNARLLNSKGKIIKRELKADLCICTDASALGYGGFVAEFKNSPCDLDAVKLIKELFDSDGACLAPEVGGGITGSLLGHKASGLQNSSDCMEHVGRAIKLKDFDIYNVGRVFPEVNTEWGKARSCTPENCNPGSGCKSLPEASSHEDNVQLSRKLTDLSKCRNVSWFVDSNQHSTDMWGKIPESVVTGAWSEYESGKSSTWRELESFRRVLLSNVKIVAGSQVLLYTDNKNLTYILSSGSTIDDLHELCMSIHLACEKHSIGLMAVWIPRERNVEADYLSRCLECDDWSVSRDVFVYLDAKWGPHTVDRFAIQYNAQCNRFNSRWWVPGCETVDSFTVDWSYDVNWLVPPPARIMDCIDKMRIDGCQGTLIIPEWKSAPFWPLLVNETGSFREGIVDTFMLPVVGGVCGGRGNNGVFGKEPFSFRMVALKCDWSKHR